MTTTSLRSAWCLLSLLVCGVASAQTRTDVPAPATAAAPTRTALDRWMIGQPAVARSLIWQEMDGTLRPYDQWSPSRRADLEVQVARAERGEAGFEDPLPNALAPMLGDEDLVYTVLSEKDAWALYLAYVANSITVDRSGVVAWRLEDLSMADLRVLFDSRSFFMDRAGIAPGPRQNRSPLGYTLVDVLPAPPAYTWRFLLSIGAPGPTRTETIARLLEWSRSNLRHYLGSRDARNLEDHWQYRGDAPVSRILDGTTHPRYGAGNWTPGCHGTNHLFISLLRTLNIPVRYVTVGEGHATPFFSSEGLYLSHGDDPYNALSRTDYPAAQLLITAEQWQAWFGPGLSVAEANRNVGRRPVELALTHQPPVYLLREYCSDLEANRARHESRVFQLFSRFYSVGHLEEAELWSRMNVKIAEYGGCDRLPSTRASRRVQQ